MKKTAIQLVIATLDKELEKTGLGNLVGMTTYTIRKLLLTAEKIEKDQIKEAFKSGHGIPGEMECYAENYYNETYK